MKFAVIGGTGLIGSRVVENLNAAGHQAIPHSLATGVDIITGQGLETAVAGADVVINLTNSPTFDDASLGGTCTGPQISGTLVAGASADWQTILRDGTALGDIRYTLQTDGGDLLYVQSRGVRHGPAEVLARLGRGEDVDPSEYTFRAATQIQTAAPELDWLNKGVLICVADREAARVIFETYLVG